MTIKLHDFTWISHQVWHERNVSARFKCAMINNNHGACWAQRRAPSRFILFCFGFAFFFPTYSRHTSAATKQRGITFSDKNLMNWYMLNIFYEFSCTYRVIGHFVLIEICPNCTFCVECVTRASVFDVPSIADFNMNHRTNRPVTVRWRKKNALLNGMCVDF